MSEVRINQETSNFSGEKEEKYQYRTISINTI